VSAVSLSLAAVRGRVRATGLLLSPGTRAGSPAPGSSFRRSRSRSAFDPLALRAVSQSTMGYAAFGQSLSDSALTLVSRTLFISFYQDIIVMGVNFCGRS
jgi:hypothetical protein